VIDHVAAIQTLHRWWFHYDEADVERWPALLTDDVHSSSRTDTGQHPYESFIASDIRGKDAVLAWKREHRGGSPTPLRHHATNVHVVAERDGEVDLRSYLLVNELTDRKPSMLSSGIVHVTVREVDGALLISRLDVVLDS
jgi:3-phenylpropionate/cinnamic acid dioxygenase small subunit